MVKKPDEREEDGEGGTEYPCFEDWSARSELELFDVPTRDEDELECPVEDCLEERREYCCIINGGTGGSNGISTESDGSMGNM